MLGLLECMNYCLVNALCLIFVLSTWMFGYCLIDILTGLFNFVYDSVGLFQFNKLCCALCLGALFCLVFYVVVC